MMDLYIFYNQLSDRQKAVYDSLLPSLLAGKEEIPLTVKASPEEVSGVLRAIVDDHPELFWFNGSCKILAVNGIASKVSPGYNHYRKDLAQRKQFFDRAVQAYLTGTQNKKPYEKERLIHDRLVQNVSYEPNPGDQTAYAALVEKKAVCAGYTRAFQLLMQLLSIPCYVCSGTAIGSKDKDWTPHAWNIIRLDNDYYNVDITWNDSFDRSDLNHISYQYYNCPDSVIAQNHRRADDYAFLPACKGTRYSFEKIYGVSSELEVIYQDGVTCRTPAGSKKEFTDIVTAALKGNKSKTVVLSFPAKGSAVKDNAVEWFKEAVISALPRSSWGMHLNMTDYNNGWYKLEFTLEIK